MADETPDDNVSLKTRAGKWFFAQGATVIVTIGFLAVVLYIGAWRGPMVIEQIQSGYEKEHVRYTDNLKQILDSSEKQTKQLADSHEKVTSTMRELAREWRDVKQWNRAAPTAGKGE